MNWKYSIIVGLICFGLGVIVGYLISGYPTLRDILNLVPSALTMLGGLGVISIIRERHKERNQKKRDHSIKLVDRELKLRTNTYVGFDNNSLKLCINGMKSSDKTYEDYSNEIETHLEKGYSEIWVHKKECASIINNHNDLAKLLSDTTKEEIIKEINKRDLSLTEWNRKGQSPINYFVPEDLFIDVEMIIQSSYKQLFNIDHYCAIEQKNFGLKSNTKEDLLRDVIILQHPERFKWGLAIFHHFAESNLNDIETLKLIIEVAVNAALTNDNFNKLKKYKKDAEGEYTLFLRGVTEIIKSVENDYLLEGRCEICKNY